MTETDADRAGKVERRWPAAGRARRRSAATSCPAAAPAPTTINRWVTEIQAGSYTLMDTALRRHRAALPARRCTCGAPCLGRQSGPVGGRRRRAQGAGHGPRQPDAARRRRRCGSAPTSTSRSPPLKATVLPEVGDRVPGAAPPTSTRPSPTTSACTSSAATRSSTRGRSTSGAGDATGGDRPAPVGHAGGSSTAARARNAGRGG